MKDLFGMLNYFFDRDIEHAGFTFIKWVSPIFVSVRYIRNKFVTFK